MHDGAVPSTNYVFMFKDGELRLKPFDGVDWLVRRGQDETRRDFIVVDSSKFDADVVAAQCVLDFFFPFVRDR